VPEGVLVEMHSVMVDVTGRTVTAGFTGLIGQVVNHDDDVVMGVQLFGSDGGDLRDVGYKVSGQCSTFGCNVIAL